MAGGMKMNANQLWQTFLETGAPEIYLLYNHSKKVETLNVSDDSGSCTPCNGV